MNKPLWIKICGWLALVGLVGGLGLCTGLALTHPGAANDPNLQAPAAIWFLTWGGFWFLWPWLIGTLVHRSRVHRARIQATALRDIFHAR